MEKNRYLNNICVVCGKPQIGVHYHDLNEDDENV